MNTVALPGAHMSRNGVKANWPSRVILSYGGHGLDEQHPDTIVIWRDAGVDERPTDLYTNPAAKTIEFAQYWYDKQFKPSWTKNKADYYCITNEVSGSDNPYEVDILVTYEENICKLAAADGFKCVVGKIANNSPNWDLWEQYYAPFIIRTAKLYGAIYGRHVYGAGDLVNADGTISTQQPNNPSRIIRELDYLIAAGWTGGVAYCETGLDNGYGLADWNRFYFQITKFEQVLRPYADHVLGFCWWECGETGWHANYTDHLKQMTGYMTENAMPKWEQMEEPPPNYDTWEQRAWAASVAEQITRGIPLNPNAGIQSAIFADGLVPVHREIGVEGVTIQAAESLDGKTPRRVYSWQSGKPVSWFYEPGGEDPPPIEPPPPVNAIDLRRFMIADPQCWRVVRHPNGSQEDIRDMDLGDGICVRAKNSLGEWWRYDDTYAYLIHDTSPAPQEDGTERVYTITKNGKPGAQKNPLDMKVGQLWNEAGSHHVQFKAKNGCRKLSENSGYAANSAQLIRHEKNYTFNGFNQGLTFDEVVWIKTGVETQIYARQNGRSCGWVGWDAPWGKSEPVEIHWNRGALKDEPPRFCGW